MPTGRERTFGEDEIIVTKTDTHGKITYANDVFYRVSRYVESETLGQPHSMVRHPDMPRTVFSLLWETILAGTEIFAYVKNLAADGDHYWVFAHVTPSFDLSGRVVGFHSMRRSPDRRALPAIEALYRDLRAIEGEGAAVQECIAAGRRELDRRLREIGKPYDEWVFSL
ncbi:MAG: PAS domain-containing protein [Polyangiaceae bacterium]